ncbi:hypothetical protein Tsubulata_030131 [Turnera subulata]|uniref:BAH domain-containing protein n=1 Tax=Turnera subulata TaxID=218843 RepID=A0A9Q0FU14_9ROSI|nr:hypothetical protein Tsubulata_030131 [Turnera subulata]
MWEDIKSGSKWVLVIRCYFPDDLPKAVGHPCAPESNEVYESNHGISVLAGLIQGQCEVLHHTKFKERSEKQSQSETEAKNESSPVFLCKYAFSFHKSITSFFTSG